MGKLAVWLAVAAAILIACGSEVDDGKRAGTRSNADGTAESSPSSTSGGVQSNLPCDVDKILRERCQTCHGSKPAAGASTSLVTHEDLHRDVGGKKAHELVSQRIHDEARIMPPKPSALTPPELSTLDSWLGKGAPSSAERCDLAPAPDAVKPLNCKPDLVLKGTKSFTLPKPSPEDVYMCFGSTVNLSKKRHVTAFAPHVDNPKIVHHILIFKSPTPVPAEPFPCSAVGSAAWQLVAGWAPGGSNFELPPEAGFPEDVGPTNWVLQVHYNSGAGKFGGETDQSGYELCTTEDLRPNDAGVAGFGTIEIAIPPRSKLTLNCNFPATPEWIGKKFFSSFPHMHVRGAAMSTERVPLGVGTPQTISEQKSFDFNNQAQVPVSATIEAGDIIRTRCSWRNPSDQVVLFGETTDSEMCFNFLSYYPAIPLYPWVTPSLLPCIPEIGKLD